MTTHSSSFPSLSPPPGNRHRLPALIAVAIFVLACTGLLLIAERGLRADARWVIEATDAYLDKVAAELSAAIARPQATCAVLSSRTGALPVRSSVIQRLLSDSSRLTSLCRADGPSASDQDPAPEGRLEIRNSTGRTDALVAELVLADGQTLAARVDATALRELARGRVSESHEILWLTWPSGARMPLAGGPGMGTTGPAHAVSATVSSTRYRYQAGVGLGPAGLLNRYGAFLPLIGLAAAAGGLWAAQVARRRRLALDAPQTQLRQAMARGEIEGHLQPIIDLATGECAGAEMLMRWRHPEHGLLPPARFLREAQASGLLWQMTQGCFRDIAASLDSCETLPEGFMLCVNFGSTELALDGDSDRFAALARPGGRRWYTVIELPERDAREPAMAARLTALQDMGFLIALDDFGTAHSGTRWLERLSVDLVKIDMSIVSTIGTDSVTRPVLDAIIALARDTGVKLIAEGVEHPHQTSHLRRQGVAYGQGYVFSAPVPAAAFIERWLGIEESDEDPSLPSVARRSPVPDQIAQQAPHQTPH